MSRIMRSRLHRAMGIGLAAFAAFSLAGSAFGQASTWTNAVNGVWTNPAMWSAAGVPNTNLAKLTAGNGSYTVTVDAVLSNPFSGLTITNNLGNTTLLDINAMGFESRTGRIAIGRGGLLRVNTGGEMKYTGTNAIYDYNLGSTFVGIQDGGEWQVNGGTVNFTDLEVSSPGRSYLYVGDNGTTGRLTIASGSFTVMGYKGSRGTNTALFLRLGNSIGGYGIMQMSGGTAVFSGHDSGGTVNFNIARGELTLTNDALLILTNRLMVAGDNSSSGRVTVAGNANIRVMAMVGVGNGTGARGNIRVQDNGTFQAKGGIMVAGVGNENCYGTGTVTLAGGTFFSGGFDLAAVRANTTGDGRLEVFGGKLFLVTGDYGLRFGNPASNGFSRASLNMTDGLICLTNGFYYQTDHPFNGFALGEAGYGSPTGIAYAVANISGGVISNSGQFGIGVWRGGTGVLYQSGGYIRQISPRAATVGWGGGNGTYIMSNGTFYGDSIFCVGGITPAMLGFSLPAMVDPSIGLLNVKGGAFSVSNTMYVGAFGTGTLTVGSNGVVRCRDLVLSNAPSSTLRFEVATDGTVGQLVVTNKLTIVPGSKLEVYVPRSYVPDVPVKVLTLATYATNVGSFADVTVSNYPGATVVQTTTKIQVRIPSRQGTLILIR